MKLLIIILSITLFSCDGNSSPEGRMTNKMEDIRNELDSLKRQNLVVLDSLSKLHEQVKQLQFKQ